MLFSSQLSMFHEMQNLMDEHFMKHRVNNLCGGCGDCGDYSREVWRMWRL